MFWQLSKGSVKSRLINRPWEMRSYLTTYVSGHRKERCWYFRINTKEVIYENGFTPATFPGQLQELIISFSRIFCISNNSEATKTNDKSYLLCFKTWRHSGISIDVFNWPEKSKISPLAGRQNWVWDETVLFETKKCIKKTRRRHW